MDRNGQNGREKQTRKVICPRCKYAVEIPVKLYPRRGWVCDECDYELGDFPLELRIQIKQEEEEAKKK